MPFVAHEFRKKRSKNIRENCIRELCTQHFPKHFCLKQGSENFSAQESSSTIEEEGDGSTTHLMSELEVINIICFHKFRTFPRTG